MKITNSRNRRLVGAVAVLSILTALVGCTPAEETAPKASSEPKVGALDMTPRDLNISLGAQTLIYAPIYIAQSEGFFKEQALTVNEVQVQASASIQALTGGSVDLALVASQTYVVAKLQGVEAIAIQATTSADANGFVLANKEWMDEKGLTSKSPLKKRLAALKGTTIGYTTAGAITQIHAQWLLQKAGLPKDAAQLFQVGVGTATSAALERGDIDLGFYTPPNVQQLIAGGKVEMLINGLDEFPEFQDQPYSIVLASPAWLEKNGDVATRFSRAVAAAIKFIVDNPEAASKALQPTFPDIEPKLLLEAVKAMLPTFRDGGRMTKKMWDNAIDMAAETGNLATRPDTAEGKLWTNEYNK